MKHETDPLGDSDDAVGFFLFLAVVTWPIVTFVLTSHVTLTQAAVLAVPVALVCAVLFLPSIMLIGMSMVAGLFYACILFIRFVLTYL